MPNSAYHVPTDEAALTATAGRSLQGLGCSSCAGRGRLSWYLPGVLSPSQLAGFGDRLPPSLGAAYSYPVDGLGRLGAGAGSGRYNRAVDRGMYALPFVPFPGQGSRGLGQISADPSMLFLGIGLLALGAFLFGSKHGPRIRRHRVARLRRRLSRLEAL